MYYRFDPRPKINLALYRNRVQGELKVSYEKEINDFVERNRDEILQVLSELVQIRTENIPPCGNEKKGQEYLYNKLTEFIPEKDIEVFDTDEIEGIKEHPLFFPTIDGMKRRYKGRPNLVATLRGMGGGSSLVLSGHVDTVPAGEEHWKIFDDPFSGKIKNGKLYGRGSMDMKGGLVASLFAIKCVTELGLGLKGDVFFESVVDEEYGGVNGTLACRLRYPNIDFAILSEPSGLVSGIETRG
ncbi:MAG: M20/M25/M40 family metallo-hydrolase, partial [Actinobacteria bacterium]|nr:M20/M25/M40 family metallo-hydrolase [Actinomycetota bacterium]